MNKTGIVQTLIQAALWLALALALAGSISHLAWSFGSLEDGNMVTAWIQAIAVDAGLLGLSYSIQVRKRQRRKTRVLWLGVLLFSGVSIYGNTLHGLYFADTLGIGWLELARPFVLSAVLPVICLYLTEVLSEDVQHSVKVEEREKKKADRARQKKEEARQPAVSKPVPETSDPGLETSEPVQIEDAQAVRARRQRMSKSQAQDKLLSILTEEPDIQVVELAKAIGRSRQTAYAYLSELEEAGQLSKNGQGYKVLSG